MSSIIKRIEAYLFESSNFMNKRVAVILLMLSCIFYLLMIFPDINILFHEIYQDTATISGNKFINLLIPELVEVKYLFEVVGFPVRLVTPILTSLYMLAVMLVIIDVKPLMFSVIAMLIHMVFSFSTYLHSFGVDTYISFALFINLMIQLSRLKIKSFSIIYPYTIRFAQIQLCIIYFFAGIGKAVGVDWIDGNAMWLVSTIYMGQVGEWLAKLMIAFPVLSIMLSWSILALEIFYPLLIHTKRLRVITLTGVIAMHISIALFMSLYSFGVVMIVLNLVGFGHYYRPIWDKLKAKLLPFLSAQQRALYPSDG